MNPTTNPYHCCCVSGTGKYYDKYRESDYWCESQADCEDESCTFWPLCVGKEAQLWEEQRDACCIEAKPLKCCEKGLALRALSVMQCAWDSAFFAACFPLCVGTTVTSCGAGAIAGVLCCAQECCYTAENKQKVREDAEYCANWALECYGNGMQCSLALCAISVKALACCPIKICFSEFANMWCWNNECNRYLFKATRWNDSYKDCITTPAAAETPQSPQQKAEESSL